ncbi:MAG: hypothetical protein JWR38_912 [Mucilaginibacter sp.]|nr:hypothetical protein [Mucilaginibacter sp.]
MRIIILAGAVSLGIILFTVYTMMDAQISYSVTPMPEYNNLFTKDVQQKLHILTTIRSRNREPIATYTYENRFNICVSKILLSKDLPLKRLISFQNTFSFQSFNPFYADLPSFNFHMNIKASKSVSASIVHFKYSGNPGIAIKKNDSLYCYYLKFKTFSINYNDESDDILAYSDESVIPAGFAFVKKNSFLYVIIITEAEGKKALEPDLIYNIINKREVDERDNVLKPIKPPPRSVSHLF